MAAEVYYESWCAEIARALWFVPEARTWTLAVVEGQITPRTWVRLVSERLPAAYAEAVVDEALVHLTMHQLASSWILSMEELGRPLTEKQQLDLLEAAISDVGDHFVSETESEVIGIGRALALLHSDPVVARARLDNHLPRISADPRVLLATLTEAPCRDAALGWLEAGALGEAENAGADVAHYRAFFDDEPGTVLRLVDRLDELADYAGALQDVEPDPEPTVLGGQSMRLLANELFAVLSEDE